MIIFKLNVLIMFDYTFKLVNILGLCSLAVHAADRTLEVTNKTKCGVNNCHETKADKINVHLIAHTHNDVGWLKTVDQYYYGSNKGHAPFGVQYILDSVISELYKNENRRFVYVETAYFSTWWNEADEGSKNMVYDLVDQGRLEFLHGGWCMSDEATPHYTAMIDQMTLGLKFLNATFGACGRPAVSWQIDPFGHSSEAAIEFAEMGFDALFVGRIDYEDYTSRKSTKSLESIWRPDPSLAEAGELFTSVLFDLYLAPAGFCFDAYCSDEPIMDNKNLHGYNVEEKIKKFEEHVERYKQTYKTNNVLVTMGGDFTFTAASPWFKNMDKLIKYINEADNNLHLLYSTPSCYLNALHSLNTTWPVKERDDYFPYGSDEHSYWTGYYTSRPASKYFIYLANNLLQGAKQIATLLEFTSLQEVEFEFKKAVAIVQHHDGVSGTEKQHVSDDYSVYLQEGVNAGQKIFSEAYKRVYGPTYPDQEFGNLRNISQFKLSEDHQHFLVTIYNPTSKKKTIPVKFPVLKDNYYQIFNISGAAVQTDFVPIPGNLNKLPGRKSNATHDLVFMARDIPALGSVNYYVQASQARPAGAETQTEPRPVNNSVVVLSNGKIELTFNKTDGLLISITKNNVTSPFHQNFYSYSPMKGYNYNAETRASGAYIFRPSSKEPKEIFNNATITEYNKGTNIFEIRQKFSPWISQVVRLYKDSEDIEFEWLIGPLPIIDWTGIEFVTKYVTDVASNGTFYTDSNGRRWMKRIRNHRKYWNTTITEPVASNYYPLTTSMCIRDSSKQVTVITDRPEGGTSMADGELEIMLHRRLLYDDNKGVVEPLDETAFGEGLVIRGTHVVQFNKIEDAAAAHRFKAIESAYHPVPTFARTTLELNEWLRGFNKTFSLLATELPASVHILTLERWKENEILLRLEHIFQTNESSEYSKAVTVDVKKLFSSFNVNRVLELTLAANLEKEKLVRKKWNYEGPQPPKKPEVPNEPVAVADQITLQPMQIRTLLLFIEPIKTPNSSPPP